MFYYTSDSAEATMALGEKLGKLLKAGDVVTLIGDLGAGKTHFSKGVARGLGVTEHVTSPTFTIINEYNGKLPFYHIDAYRIEDTSELYDIGFEDYIYGQGVTLIEWPQILEEVLPKEILEIKIVKDTSEDNLRLIIFRPVGTHYDFLVKELTK